MASEHEIQGLMQTAMNSLKEMINVNTVIGDMMETETGTSIIPVSQVACGFMAGGGEYGKEIGKDASKGLPFAGGSGAGVSVQPVGFLVVSGDQVRLISIKGDRTIEHIIEAIPIVAEELQELLNRGKDKSDEIPLEH